MARIAFVDLTFNWPPVGGCWVDLKEIAERLQLAGHTVAVFVPDFDRYYPRGEITEDIPLRVTRVPFNRFSFNAPTAGRRFRETLRGFRPDLVFAGDGYFMKAALLPYLEEWPVVLRFYAYEIVCFNLHYYLYGEGRVCDGNFIEDPVRCHRCWYTRRSSFAKHLGGIVLGAEGKHLAAHFSQEYIGSLAFTRRYRSRLREWLRIPRAVIVYNRFTRELLAPYNPNILMIPSGVDTRRFISRDGSSGAGERPVILMTGRVDDPLKGFGVLLEACDRLRAGGVPFRLLVTTPETVSEERPYLENAGWVNQVELPGLYRRGSIAVVPSTWVEPFGIAAVEAMAAGLPVAASRIGGLETSVVDGETGFLVPPGNANALADRLERLLTDGGLRRRMGQAGRIRAEREFDWDRIVERHYLPLVKTVTGD